MTVDKFTPVFTTALILSILSTVSILFAESKFIQSLSFLLTSLHFFLGGGIYFVTTVVS